MNLQEFFLKQTKVAIAFSGGVDSAYLLYAAKQYAKEVKAYYVKSEFQPQFELDDAVRLAKELKIALKILNLNILKFSCVTDNPKDRCYHCKKEIFSVISLAAKEDGFTVLLDGTNASDDADDRPGMKALQELSVLSPLRECGLTKENVRRLSKEAKLFTWNKPAYACLATRIAAGEKITDEKLSVTETAEDFMASLGFADFRVRMESGTAKIQLKEEQWPLLLQHRTMIAEKLKQYYKSVVVDMEVR